VTLLAVDGRSVSFRGHVSRTASERAFFVSVDACG
jgi:hypothetical protein